MEKQQILQEEQVNVKLVAWPSPQDYNEAVQTPRFSFIDPELRDAESEVDQWGLPKPRTGNFASVYKLSSTRRTYAVRFFLHNLTGQRERYRLIQEALNGLQADFTVGFSYMEEGIKLWGNWFPALKMEWSDGSPLTTFIDKHLQNRNELLRVAQSIAEMNLELRARGMAHGDLQHGNILIEDSGVKLVDYDGMFVPSLAGALSGELGHRNYQHPSRCERHFDSFLDNFSAWVIYVSLISLAEDPGLWSLLDGGDECLLFRQEDFLNPNASNAFYVLENHRSGKIRTYASFLRGLLRMDLSAIPFLDSEIHAVNDLTPVCLPTCDVEDRRRQELTSVTSEFIMARTSAVSLGKQASAARSQPNSAVLAMFCLVFVLWPVWSVVSAVFGGSHELSFAPVPLPLSTENTGNKDFDTEKKTLITSADLVASREGDRLVKEARDEHERGLYAFALTRYRAAIEAYEASSSPDHERLGYCWAQIAHNQDHDPYSEGSKVDTRESWRNAEGHFLLFTADPKRKQGSKLVKTKLANAWHWLAHAQSSLAEPNAAGASLWEAWNIYTELGDSKGMEDIRKDQLEVGKGGTLN
jgi:hypothetical protein